MRLLTAEWEHRMDAARLLMKLWPGHTEEEMQVCALAYMEDAKKAAILAKEEGQFCGICLVSLRHDYVEGTEESPVGYLEGIYVEDSCRGQGVARALLSAAQNWAREQGCHAFASDCELDNTDSLQFHLACGFREANRIICFVKEIK